ncbi:lysosomal amino acid transporter 1 homolog isoform X2 [Hirundo rustica]|uniref:lysosomal amino acid transporter 1 homolog isoform X2 n=1 Tax=Hirundo rustica TaxID=43150 RepID=UPI001A93B6F5|nr:lysosomal amino acid transporter 1 homolog isoform X2 [Hirundo rustica]
MAARRWRGLSFGNLSGCPNGSQWIMDVFNECAQDSRDVASIVLGLGSIGCFIAAAFPQFYQACRTGIMDQALSIYFLLGWLGGDLLNLIGSFLADQLPLQVYTAIYYVLADLGMLSLYCYYRVKNGGRAFPAPINAAFVFLSVGSLSSLSLLGSASTEDPGTFRGRSLLSAPGDELAPKETVTAWEGDPGKRALPKILPKIQSLLQDFRDFRAFSLQTSSTSVGAAQESANLTFPTSLFANRLYPR